MKRCGVCGRENYDDAMFCDVCGCKFEDAQPQRDDDLPLVKTKRFRIAALIITLLAIPVICILVFGFTIKDRYGNPSIVYDSKAQTLYRCKIDYDYNGEDGRYSSTVIITSITRDKRGVEEAVYNEDGLATKSTMIETRLTDRSFIVWDSERILTHPEADIAKYTLYNTRNGTRYEIGDSIGPYLQEIKTP